MTSTESQPQVAAAQAKTVAGMEAWRTANPRGEPAWPVQTRSRRRVHAWAPGAWPRALDPWTPNHRRVLPVVESTELPLRHIPDKSRYVATNETGNLAVYEGDLRAQSLVCSRPGCVRILDGLDTDGVLRAVLAEFLGAAGWHYIYVGHRVYEFVVQSRVWRFHAPVDTNASNDGHWITPYALTEEGAGYMLAEGRAYAAVSGCVCPEKPASALASEGAQEPHTAECVMRPVILAERLAKIVAEPEDMAVPQDPPRPPMCPAFEGITGLVYVCPGAKTPEGCDSDPEGETRTGLCYLSPHEVEREYNAWVRMFGPMSLVKADSQTPVACEEFAALMRRYAAAYGITEFWQFDVAVRSALAPYDIIDVDDAALATATVPGSQPGSADGAPAPEFVID